MFLMAAEGAISSLFMGRIYSVGRIRRSGFVEIFSRRPSKPGHGLIFPHRSSGLSMLAEAAPEQGAGIDRKPALQIIAGWRGRSDGQAAHQYQDAHPED